MADSVQYYGTGRRKSSVARVRLVPGTGKITINKSCLLYTSASLGAQSWIVKLLGKIINDKKKYIRVISSEH